MAPYKPRITAFEKDHVYLFQFPAVTVPGATKLCASPYGAKVETYLRLTKIPFTAVPGHVVGPYGKCPFIELNGEMHTDSSTIVDVLVAKFGHDLNAGLTAEQKAVGHAFHRLAEDSMYFYLLYSRYVDDGGWSHSVQAYFNQPGVLMRTALNYAMRPKMIKQCQSQGVGRFPVSVVIERFDKDLRAISDQLGNNDYILGTAAPTYVDVVVYAQLDCLLNAGIKTILDGTLQNYPSLTAYTKRITALIFPATEEPTTSA